VNTKSYKKVLILGSTGKMGLALNAVFAGAWDVVGKNSEDFDAYDFPAVKSLIKNINPDIVINTVAFMGLDACEKDPQKALNLNTLFPKSLAEFSNEAEFLLVHFSTDAVFNGSNKKVYLETDCPQPINFYGYTKFGGDCFIKAIAKKYYIFRISIIFGQTIKTNQFVEKMLDKVKKGEKVLKLSEDLISSPSYSKDIAAEVRRIIETSLPFELYHVANEGRVSLYDFFKEIVKNLHIPVKLVKTSYLDFPHVGLKNIHTPIKSNSLHSLRFWKDAVKDYCSNIEL
jgi:dTDP-4-dehydrorhamnose reductase